MRTRTQIRPLGTDAATTHALAQQSRANEELQFFDSPDIGFRQTTRGMTAYLKRRFVQGKSGFPWQSKKELDPTVAVAQDTFVFISPLNDLVTTGLVDLMSNALTLAQPGIWQAMQDVPAQVTVSGVVKYNVPQPLVSAAVSGTPLKGDADDTGLFWLRWPPTNSCF